MYAVIVSGGKQYPVTPGDVVRLEKLPEAEGSAIEFDKVALVANDSGEVTVGTPWVEGARVKGEVTAQGLGKKVMIIKFHRRQNYRRRKGHRQPYTEVRISEILGK